MVASGENDMGHSQYDLAGRGRPAWNAGRKVGVKPKFDSGASISR